PTPYPIGEREMPAVGFQLPAGGLVLDTAVVFLETGVALLPGFALATVLVEAGNRLPGTIGGGVPSHGVEMRCEWVVPRKLGAVRLQVVPSDAASIDPQP